MAAYTPTVWVNNQAPPLSAANLNKLTDELKAQASDQSVLTTLGTAATWTDGVEPALTTSETLNEMERVAQVVAATLGLSYTPTTWQTGWTPSRNAYRFNRLEQQAEANRYLIDNPPLSDYIDTFSELTSIWLPTNTYPPNIQNGVTNPVGLGGGAWEIADAAGSGFRMLATPQMPSPWESAKKVCLAQLLIRNAVGQFEEWRFKYRYPAAYNSAWPSGFHAGTIFEFGHHLTNSGVYIGLDARAGGEGHHIGVPKAGFTDGAPGGDFDFYRICDVDQLQLDHDYLCEARFRYNPDATGYIRVIIDGVPIVNEYRPMRPNTAEIPKCQPGWYSNLGTTANGVELRNLEYAYGVA